MFAVPIFQTFLYSLQDWDGIRDMAFVGIDNYVEVLFQDRVFWRGVFNTFFLFAFLIVAQVPPALILAMLIARHKRGSRFFKVAYFIPMIMSTVAVSLLWIRIYEPNYGLLNQLLEGMGLESLTNAWLSDPSISMLAVSVPIAWQGIGFHLVLLYAGIRAIPDQYYEAALIDGASGIWAEVHITLPLLRDVIKVSVVMAAIGSLKMFDVIWIMTQGGPMQSTSTVAIQMYKEAFQRLNYGYGSAIAIFLLVECLAISWILNRGLTGEKIEY
jgi:raffinose/stachyose/melibiose transport system permease protein